MSNEAGGNSWAGNPVSFADAREIVPGSVLESEVLIVGGGAAGITLARALAARGFAVLLAEAGDWRPDAATQALYDLDCVGYPLRPNHMSRAREFGGSCNLWAGRAMRLQPLDFAARPWVPESGWPIPAAEIERYLDAVAAILELPGGADAFSLAAWHHHLGAAERQLLEAGPFAPAISLWARRPKRFARAYQRELAQSPKIRVLLRANAVRLRLAADGRQIAAVDFATLEGRRLTVAARLVVLAMGGLEIPRLLLWSDRLDPRLLGPRRALVGRFFMDHPRTAFGRVVLRGDASLPLMRTWPVAGGKVQLGLALSAELQQREGLLNHYATFEEEGSAYAEAHWHLALELGKVILRRGHAGSRLDLGRVRQAPRVEHLRYLLSPKELLPHDLWRFWRLLKERLRRQRPEQRYIVVYFCEQPPAPESRVWLGEKLDALGVPRLVFDWRIPDAVHASLFRLQEEIGRALARSNLGRLEPGQGMPCYTDASHHMGTTRMHPDPQRGVVDTDCRLHGTANLWIASSSVFPTCGHANPTLTILALVLRLAEHLAALRHRLG